MINRNAEITSERGQSLVELALSITFVLVLLAGVVDLGRAMYTWVTLRDAAQEGASYGSFCPHMVDDIEQRVRQSSTQPVDLGSTDVVVSCVYTNGVQCTTTSGTVAQGDGVKVTVTFTNFRLSMPFIGAIVGAQSFPITADVTDTILATDCPVT